MLNIKCRTEYTFRAAYGKVEDVIAAGGVGICDRHGTWGHVQFSKAAKKAGIKPFFGVELAVVQNASKREKQGANYMSFLALNNNGLNQIYKLTSLATQQYYYMPRIDYGNIWDLTEDVAILSGVLPHFGDLPRKSNVYIEISPVMTQNVYIRLKGMGYKTVAVSDNFFPKPENRGTYEIIASLNRDNRTQPMHILNEWEWKDCLPWADYEEAIKNSKELYERADAELPVARLVEFNATKTLQQLCEEGALKRKCDLKNNTYKDRLNRELGLIKEKDFEDYFYVIADMVAYAKEHMLVGPARGSSCGSLVCYLLGITDIDPIPYDLLFERFIDINREDLPDIDIDFQDDRRELVFDYLKNKYGNEKVARLGTVMRYKARSAIDDVARELKFPMWEMKELKDTMIERSTGDSRAEQCIIDTFEQTDIGKKTLEKFPELRAASELEGHARQTGQHAAGVLVTNEDISNYCSVNHYLGGVVMIDKKDAEDLNLLKIDALGLSTLSIIQDTLDNVGWTREQLLNHPLDDDKAFRILREGKFSGIFQFKGLALQGICKQMPIKKFEEIAAVTALARPGPLTSGGATEYIRRHNGERKITYIHPLMEEYTKDTNGIVVYQEQVMQIVRNIGKLTWEDTSTLRKAMSKSYGREYFDKFKVRFVSGAEELGVSEEEAVEIWENVNTMGSWSFNKSHAIAYGLVSYWCCVLKAYFPLEYAAACLRSEKKEEEATNLIRELVKEGYEYKPYDPKNSVVNWSVSNNILIGGLTNLKGCGQKTAEDILKRREMGVPLTKKQERLLLVGTTPYDNIFETKEKWGDIYTHPEKYNLITTPTEIENIDTSKDGIYTVFGKMLTKNLRDLNEAIQIQKRGGRIYDELTEEAFITIADDTGNFKLKIGRYKYQKYGKKIIEEGKVGDWYVARGKIRAGFGMMYVDVIRKVSK